MVKTSDTTTVLRAIIAMYSMAAGQKIGEIRIDNVKEIEGFYSLFAELYVKNEHTPPCTP